MSRKQNLILLYTGDGKGKTSAALGLVLRACGHGGRCAVAQFIKSGEFASGEEKSARNLGVTWRHFGAGFTWIAENEAANRSLAKTGWNEVQKWLISGLYDLVVLDEFTYPLNFGYLEESEVISWLNRERQQETFPHLVITGRGASENLIALSDLTSAVVEVKHHFQQGQGTAQIMIEY